MSDNHRKTIAAAAKAGLASIGLVALLLGPGSANGAQNLQADRIPAPILNSSFEEGAVGRPPPDWYISSRRGGPFPAEDFVARFDSDDPNEGPAGTGLWLGMDQTDRGRASPGHVQPRVLGIGNQTRLPSNPAEPLPRPRPASNEGDQPPRAATRQGLANLEAFARLYGALRFFSPSDEAASADWDRFTIAALPLVENAANVAALQRVLATFTAAVAPAARVLGADQFAPTVYSRPGEAQGPALSWRHVGWSEHHLSGTRSERVPNEAAEGEVAVVELGSGLRAWVPLQVWRDASGHTIPRTRASLPEWQKPDGYQPSGFDRTTRLAAVIEMWNSAQHFYPYFDVARVRWSDHLAPALRAAALDRDDFAFADTLRRLTNSLEDGHARITYQTPRTGTLPITWDHIEGRLVITGVSAGADIRVGDVATHFEGQPIDGALAEKKKLVSGSSQAADYRARRDLLLGPESDTVELQLLDHTSRPYRVSLTYSAEFSANPIKQVRPPQIHPLEPGVMYVDLERASEADIKAAEAQLESARGIVFDLRGYPKTSYYLAHLTSQMALSPHFDRPIYMRPDQDRADWDKAGWGIAPITPRWTENIVFIADLPAISYSETVLGVIKGNRLGTIVGEPTAGANGNISAAYLPGNYGFIWTGMRTLNRDGSQHHLIGILPDVPVSPTIEGIRAGRDEMLEKALEIVRAGRQSS